MNSKPWRKRETIYPSIFRNSGLERGPAKTGLKPRTVGHFKVPGCLGVYIQSWDLGYLGDHIVVYTRSWTVYKSKNVSELLKKNLVLAWGPAQHKNFELFFIQIDGLLLKLWTFPESDNFDVAHCFVRFHLHSLQWPSSLVVAKLYQHLATLFYLENFTPQGPTS